MTNYLQSLLPRIRQFSKQLNDEANFVEIPWAFLDEEGAKVTYIFRRNNELLVSRHGDVATGRWEYLPVVQSLLIEYQGGKRLYNQGFLDNAVMVLRKDGTEELFALANSKRLTDLSIFEYLAKLEKERIGPKRQDAPVAFATQLTGGEKVIFWGEEGENGVWLKVGTKVTLEDNTPLADGQYTLKSGDKMLVTNGIVLSYDPDLSGLWLTLGVFLMISLFVVLLIVLVSE